MVAGRGHTVTALLRSGNGSGRSHGGFFQVYSPCHSHMDLFNLHREHLVTRGAYVGRRGCKQDDIGCLVELACEDTLTAVH